MAMILTANEKLARTFAEENGGKLVGITYGYLLRKSGERSHSGVKIDIDGHRIHHYFSRVWHRNKQAISVSEEQLQLALDENALIIINHLGHLKCANAVSWELWANQDKNYELHRRYHKKEIYCQIDMLRPFDINKLEQYYDDYDKVQDKYL